MYLENSDIFAGRLTCVLGCANDVNKNMVLEHKQLVSQHPHSFTGLSNGIRSTLAMKFFDIINRVAKNSDRRTELIRHAVEGLDNQSTAVNQRLDRLIEALDNQSTAFNERLDRLIEARDDLSTVNKRLVKLFEAHDKQARAVNDRLDKIIDLLRATAPETGSQPPGANNTTVHSSGDANYLSAIPCMRTIGHMPKTCPNSAMKSESHRQC